MARTKQPKSSIPENPLANGRAVRIMAALAGGSRNLGEIARCSYNKIHTLASKGTGDASFLFQVYRALDSHPEFKAILEDTWAILDTLREMGKISPVSIMEMTEVEGRVFDAIHTPTPPTPPTPPEPEPLPPAASHPNPAVRAFFVNKQNKKPVDKPGRPDYSSSIVDELFTDKPAKAAKPEGDDDATPIAQTEQAVTGDLMNLINTKPNGTNTAITDPFESNLKQIPDKYDSENKRF